jgi:thymidylate synthase ThyX
MARSALPLTVSLISSPTNPLETLFLVWEQSRSNRKLPSAEEISKIRSLSDPGYQVNGYGVSPNAARVLQSLGFPATPSGYMDFKKYFDSMIVFILSESIPVTENLQFVFYIENIPISLREQLVRHRIGNRVGPRVSFDIIPELEGSTFWSQTSRVIPFNDFFEEGRYLVPNSLKGKTVEDRKCWNTGSPYQEDQEKAQFDAEAYYLDTLLLLQHRYSVLKDSGVHIEDCRQIIPVAATHSITWGINLKAMLHIFSKRASWIAQVGLWEELISQMVKALVDIDPIFQMVVRPACTKAGKYIGCPVNGTNVERIAGVDGMPPCPLWVNRETSSAIEAWRSTVKGEWASKGKTTPTWSPPLDENGEPDLRLSGDIRNWSSSSSTETKMLLESANRFKRLWNFDVYQGPEDLATG